MPTKGYDNDYSIPVDETPADAYGFKRAVFSAISATGKEVTPRSFLYGRCPIDGTVIVRSAGDDRLAKISSEHHAVPRVEAGQDYEFALRATPMQQTPQGKRPCDPERWFLRQQAGLGIELLAQYHRASWTWCGKSTATDRNGFYIPDVVFLGRLHVRDANRFTQALQTGIGRHRAFGFGLLQVFD
jgi:CRISPR-associated protein Cse3 family